MLLLRALARLITLVWCLVLALGALALALFCVDPVFKLGSARPDRLLSLPTVRQHVGRFLTQVATPGSVAILALICGVGAVAIGLLLLIGLLTPGRVRQAVLDDDAAGRLAARPRTLREMTRALAEQVAGATSIDRPKLRLSRRGRRGRVRIGATRSQTADAETVRSALTESLAPVTEPFHLSPRVRVRYDPDAERVQ
jgi:hypothetical protein